MTRLKQPTGMVPYSTLDKRGLTRAGDGSDSFVEFDIRTDDMDGTGKYVTMSWTWNCSRPSGLVQHRQKWPLDKSLVP